jgi:hypothetical protein
MKSFAYNRQLQSAPRADSGWMPPHLPRVMRDNDEHPLGERIAEAVVWCAEEAAALRRAKGAIFPQAPHRDAAWSIMLDVLFAETRGSPATVDSLAQFADAPASKCGLWVEILERLGLLRLQEAAAGGSEIVLTYAARAVMLQLLLDPVSWNGPVLCHNIGVSHLWQLTQLHNCLD